MENSIHILDTQFLGLEQTIATFLMESPAGPILIETGPHSTFSRLEQLIQQKGYSISDIQHVFLTHIHLDHAGAAWAFAEHGATIYVHPFGYKHLADPSKLMASAQRIYKEHMDRLWGQMKAIPETQLRAVPHGEAITIGDLVVNAWHTPGHAVHHIAWQIGDALFAGDVAGVKINNGMVVPPCPPPDIHVEDWQKSIALIKNLDLKHVYLTHFGSIDNVNTHLEDLEKTLLTWANWMKPKWEERADKKLITPDFQAFVQQQLLDFGVPQSDLPYYEAANPSWMSVAGLMRYWRKKEEKTQ